MIKMNNIKKIENKNQKCFILFCVEIPGAHANASVVLFVQFYGVNNNKKKRVRAHGVQERQMLFLRYLRRLKRPATPKYYINMIYLGGLACVRSLPEMIKKKIQKLNGGREILYSASTSTRVYLPHRQVFATISTPCSCHS